MGKCGKRKEMYPRRLLQTNTLGDEKPSSYREPTFWINFSGNEKLSSYRHPHIIDKILGNKKLSIISVSSLLFYSLCFFLRNGFIFSKLPWSSEILSMNNGRSSQAGLSLLPTLGSSSSSGRFRVTITQVVLNHASRYSDFYSKPHAYEVFGLFPRKAGPSVAWVCFPDAFG